MCGLAGIIFGEQQRSDTERRRLLAIFAKMMIDSERRGPDATGIAWLNTDGTYALRKRPWPAREFIVGDKETLGLMGDEVSDETTVLMGHTRWVTRGNEHIAGNNHPIRAGSIIGTHNGTIYNADDLFEKFDLYRNAQVDSELLFRLASITARGGRINRKRLLKRIKHCRGNMAVVMASTARPDEILILKGNKPLEFRYHPELNVVLYASENTFLDAALTSQKGWRPMRIKAMRAIKFRRENLGNPIIVKYDFDRQAKRGTVGAIDDWESGAASTAGARYGQRGWRTYRAPRSTLRRDAADWARQLNQPAKPSTGNIVSINRDTAKVAKARAAKARAMAKAQSKLPAGPLAIFVYGTLKQGHGNHRTFCKDAVRVEEATVTGRLYQGPGFPLLEVPEPNILAFGSRSVHRDVALQKKIASVPALAGEEIDSRDTNATSDWDTVYGELILFDNAARALPLIDQLEGYRPGDERSMYIRVLVPVMTYSGLPVLAWAYRSNSQSMRRQYLPGGHWTPHWFNAEAYAEYGIEDDDFEALDLSDDEEIDEYLKARM